MLCYDVTEKVVQHIVHCIETQGRHVEYLKVLQTLVKAEGQSIRKTQDMVMAEVRYNFRDHEFRFEKWLKERWRREGTNEGLLIWPFPKTQLYYTARTFYFTLLFSLVSSLPQNLTLKV